MNYPTELKYTRSHEWMRMEDGVAVVGIDVPHTHIHLMPLNNPGDLNFSHHVSMQPDEMKALAAQIAAAIE